MKQLSTTVLFFLILCGAGASYAQNQGKVTVVIDPLIDSLIAKRLALSKVPNTRGTVSVSSSLSGYRVQIYYGSDRRKAYAEQIRFRTIYPKINAYISYKEPNYRIRVGDYRSRAEAQRLLNQLRPVFPTLFVFQERINPPKLDTVSDDH